VDKFGNNTLLLTCLLNETAFVSIPGNGQEY